MFHVEPYGMGTHIHQENSLNLLSSAFAVIQKTWHKQLYCVLSTSLNIQDKTNEHSTKKKI